MQLRLLAFVLAGGKGTRLYPLTKERAKPAVPFGGKYRIIDFVLSNCINSGLRRIFIATQYKSLSLNRHIRMGWSIVSEELGEFIEILPPQKRVGEHWYLGTADAETTFLKTDHWDVQAPGAAEVFPAESFTLTSPSARRS